MILWIVRKPRQRTEVRIGHSPHWIEVAHDSYILEVAVKVSLHDKLIADLPIGLNLEMHIGLPVYFFMRPTCVNASQTADTGALMSTRSSMDLMSAGDVFMTPNA